MTFFTKRYHPPGTPPGTLTQMPAEEAMPLRIRLIDYDKDKVTVKDNVEAADCHAFLASSSSTWIHVQGHPTEAALRELGSAFSLHALALEDVLNTGQRPKVDKFDDQLFIIMSLPTIEEDRVTIQQVSLFLHKTFLISFCVGDFAPFEPVVRRLQAEGSRLRSRGVDFLLYSLIDLVIDQGFPVLEDFGLQLEDLEEQILESVGRETLHRIHTVKRELILLRRMLWPQREAVNQLLRGDYETIRAETLIYLRDCYDHTIQVMDLLETYRDMAGSMLDIYLSSVSNRMNDVMRVLTVIATIFIPLTFIVGVYGMNFDRTAGAWNMPELGWPFGYLLIWVVMILIAVLMVVFFRRRGWF
ncbi:MAG: magnesium/cobalt transporter CorA [Gammaproteobacteria bacterium]|nr:magnesium/cobalt transporter CorA [Pseudomonadales bacterium]MCP5348946.1 magnesium/cobalt transporter CorA [Pseudomonadales bacterium]